MAALIKNALIKQLSKFLKNVSANQINISTLKGEGEMTSIQLNENVLMDLIELPTWLRITNARCNKASIKIQWTKLKTNPIIITLDRIELDMELADPLRDISSNNNNNNASSNLFDTSADSNNNNGPYGFIDKCVDAIQLNIDSIMVTIKSEMFNANLNMSNIYVYSVTPNWKLTNDIRNTRLKDLEKEEIILFKEISWEICRFEMCNISNSKQQQEEEQQTSIKLIMNPSKVQIALKKKLSDKTLLCSTFRVLLNEIYWMANDTQMKSAIGTYNLVSTLMKKAFVQRRKHMMTREYNNNQNKQQHQHQSNTKAQNSRQNPATQNTNVSGNLEQLESKVFCQHDIRETSLHMHISTLNIHLYADDNYSGNQLIDGGVIQFLFKQLCIDHYPYHFVAAPANASASSSPIKHWHNFNSVFEQKRAWSMQLIDEFVQKIDEILDLKLNKNMQMRTLDLSKIRLKINAQLIEACTVFTLKDFCMYKVSTNLSSKTKKKPTTTSKLSDLLLNDSNTYFLEQQMFNKRAFLSSNHAEYNLPGDTLFAQVFFSEFYFLNNDADECNNYPLPCAQVYTQIAPVLVNIDFLTLLWLNTLAFSLWREKLIVDESTNKDDAAAAPPPQPNDSSFFNIHVDTHLEFLMLKLVLHAYPNNMKHLECTGFLNRPSGLEIGIARLLLSNKSVAAHLDAAKFDIFERTVRKCNEFTQDLLSNRAKKFHENEEIVKLNHLSPCFNHLIQNKNLQYSQHNDLFQPLKSEPALDASNGLFLKPINKTALNKSSGKDLWCLELDSVWIDFLGDQIFSNQNNTTKNNINNCFVQNSSFKIWLLNVWDFYQANQTDYYSTSLMNEKKKNNNDISIGYNNIYLRDEVKMSLAEEKSYKKNLGKVICINEDFFSSYEHETLSQSSRKKRASSSLIMQNKNAQYLHKSLYSRFNIISEISELNVKLEHSKVLFLLRFIEILDTFFNQLKLDTEQTFKYKLSDYQQQKQTNKKTNSKSKNLLFLNQEEQRDSHNNRNEDEDLSSANLALIINSIRIDLIVNDFTAGENFHTNHCCSNESNKQDQANNFDEICDQKEQLSLSGNYGLDSKETSLAASIEKEKEELATQHQQQQQDEEMMRIREDFDIITRQLDREFMSNYTRFIYGLSNENPMINFGYKHSVPQPHPPPAPLTNTKESFNQKKEQQPHRTRSLSTRFTSRTNDLFNRTKTRLENLKPSSSTKNDENDLMLLENDTPPYLIDENNFIDNQQLLLSELDNFDSTSLLSVDAVTATTTTPTTTTSTNSSSSLFSESTNKLIAQTQEEVEAQAGAVQTSSPSSSNTSAAHSILSEKMNEAQQLSKCDQETQTQSRTKQIQLKLTNIKLYAQSLDERFLVSLVKLDNILVLYDDNNRREAKKETDRKDCDLLFKFKKLHKLENETFLDLVVDGFRFEIDVNILKSLAELVDDSDELILSNNKAIINKFQSLMHINLLLINSNFKLIDRIIPHKTIDLNINHLNVAKNGDQLVLNSFDTNKTSNKNETKISFERYLIEQKQRQQTAATISCSKLTIDHQTTNNYASLIFKLRQAKQALVDLQTKNEHEKRCIESAKCDLAMKLKLCQLENFELRKTIQSSNASNWTLKREHGERKEKDEDFLLTDKNESESDRTVGLSKFDIERKQFECLLKQLEEENESLKKRLEKSEEHIAILNIERECLMKNINKIK